MESKQAMGPVAAKQAELDQMAAELNARPYVPTKRASDYRTSDLPCPTCGDIHPSGIFAAFCGCKDCSLLWSTAPFEYLAPEYQDRLIELDFKRRTKASK